MTEENTVSPGEETQNPAPVTDEASEVVTPETDTQTEKPETQEDPAAKSLKRLERRIDRVTAARYQAEAEREQARQEAAQLKARLAQFEQPEEQPDIAPEKVLPIARQIARQMLEEDSLRNKVQGVLKAGRKELDGFDEACNAVNEEVPFYDANQRPTPFLNVVMESENPAAVLHYLGKNADIAAELSDLTPTQLARRIARIELEMSKPVTPKESKAPKPITPVRAASAASGGLSDDMPIEDWARAFRESRRSR